MLPPKNSQLRSLASVLEMHRNIKTAPKAARRKHEWQPIMESAFAWVRTWCAHNTTNSWPSSDFQWLQWALHYHFESEFVFCRSSTAASVAKKAREWAVMGSTRSDSFKRRCQRWGADMRPQMIILSNRQLKAKARNEHVFMYVHNYNTLYLFILYLPPQVM